MNPIPLDGDAMNDDAFDPAFENLLQSARARIDRTMAATPGPTAELLEVAWSVARGGRRWAPLVNSTILYAVQRAAGDGASSSAPVHLQDAERNQWTLSREDRLDADDEKMLRFRAHPDHVETYAGRRIEVVIGGDLFDLGVIDRYGVAVAVIPAGIDLLKRTEIHIGE